MPVGSSQHITCDTNSARKKASTTMTTSFPFSFPYLCIPVLTVLPLLLRLGSRASTLIHGQPAASAPLTSIKHASNAPPGWEPGIANKEVLPFLHLTNRVFRFTGTGTEKTDFESTTGGRSRKPNSQFLQANSFNSYEGTTSPGPDGKVQARRLQNQSPYNGKNIPQATTSSTK